MMSIALAVLSGVLCYLAFPPLGWDFLAWVCLVPLFFSVRSLGYKKAFITSYFAGFVFFGLLLSWMVNVSIPGAVLLVIIMAAYFGVFGLIVKVCLDRSLNLTLIPLSWVILEYLRGHLLSGFPWGLLGYTQYKNIHMIQMADITGAYGISFVIALVNVGCFSFFSKDRKRLFNLFTALIAVVIMAGYGVYRSDNLVGRDTLKVSVVQGNIPQDLKWDAAYARNIVRIYEELTREAALDGPDLIVWPETSYPYMTDETSKATEIAALSKELKTPIMAGLLYEEGPSYYNSAVLFNGDTEDRYSKMHLVPFGEYVPRVFDGVRKFINKPIGSCSPGKEYKLFSIKTSFTASNPGRVVRTTSFYKIGTLICFEDVFPYISRDLVARGAAILVNITNDGWFGKTAAAEQHLQASVFRAIENRVPVVRAANTGVSCFVSYTGEVTSRVKDDGRDIFVQGTKMGSVLTCNSRSFYTKNGDTFVLMCIFFAGLLVLTGLMISRPKA